MTLAPLFDSPFFTGSSPGSGEVPGKYMVGLAGRGFLVDLKSGRFVRQSVPLLRDQADSSLEPGEASINPEDLWRRTQMSWHLGSGQRNYDSKESDSARFWRSKGVDPWTQNELSLLPATTTSKVSANTNLRLAVAGTYLYLTDGTSIRYTQDLATWSDITGEPGSAASAITSDGNDVWTAHGTDGIYATTRGAASTASYVSDPVDGVRYVKGRLFAWAGESLYNVIAGGSLPTALLTHANTDFTWVDVAEGSGFYYPAGYSGDKSLIYRCDVKPDGTGLTTPTVAAELPDGEVVRAVQGYIGFLLIGTDKGIRFAATGSQGDLTLGGLIAMDNPVLCFEGQDRFVWFGWSRYDAVSTGLGRMDLSSFNGTRPAYASDLMSTNNGTITSVVTFLDKRVFCSAGDGVITEDTVLEPEGTLETGRIGYGIFDQKMTRSLIVSHLPLEGTVSAEMAKDGGDFLAIGSNIVAGSIRSSFSTNLARGETFELRVTLSRDPGDMTAGPTLTRYTLRAYPASPRSEQITVPLIIGNTQQTQTGQRLGRPALDDLNFLADLESDGRSVSYQEGRLSFPVVVEDHQWVPHHQGGNRDAYDGTYVVVLKRFAEE